MSARIHFSGGVAYNTRGRQVCYMGRGWPCCCFGEKAQRIRNRGDQTDDENRVTCPRCQALIARRVDPGPFGLGMGIPERAP